MYMNDSNVSPYLLRPCRSYADAMRDSAQGLGRQYKLLTVLHRGEGPISVTTVDASYSNNREENK